MSTSKITEPTNPKLKSISLRLTEDELNRINKLAEDNHQTKTTYILNQCLPESSPTLNIYNKNFMNTVNKLSDLANNFKSDNLETKEEIVTLRKELEKLWLYLK